ncbi:SirB1 family protein [Psychromonas sp. 14N.309.X.WAT.B.A12]|uniref:SirB1 family protein n=1 Tax=unclassified Psychromonas TaxID=2614957 RepID=UPI0025B13991|nr:tetratricopeptide repeat protein [Psychromonas sp. 14N.309.X.WAT.B.A12]MDN2662020.1 tetratricopeptide repeat protein [Psychromonas sp. 14N.309.X.WAT.B.A12]
MELDEKGTLEESVINTSLIHEGIDYQAYSLLQLASMAEAEITGHSALELQHNMRLQLIVIKSQLAAYPDTNIDKLSAILNNLYHVQNFSGDWKAFFKVKNALLSSVLSRRKGVPISLGILLIETLKETGFTAAGICFPSGFIVKVELSDGPVYIDPFNGEIVDLMQLELKVRGQLGNHARLTAEMCQADSNETIIKRYVNVLKAAYIQAESIELALLCSDILLRLDPEDAFEVRDRGFLFQQLECYQLACNDFTYFIEQCPDDPIVNLLKRQIKQMSDELAAQVIH